MSFTHLHVHTEYSLLDGMSRISELPGYAKELGMDALAITDHGAMFGVIDFYKSCKKAGIRPIIGCEVYTAARTVNDREVDKDRYSGHLILLCENQTGYKNLVKIVSASYVHGFYFKPRVDKELLKKYSEGIICLSGCLAGNVQRMLLNHDYEGARNEALELRDIFGRDNFFLEIQNHFLHEDETVIEGLKTLSKEIDVPLVATNDAHYIRKKDAAAQDVLMCIQTQTTISDENRMKFENDEFYLKSEEEMRRLFPDMPEVCDITSQIAERCNVEFEFGQYHLPEYIPPDGKTCEEYLRDLCYEGLKARYGAEALAENSEYRSRLAMELGVIESMGYVEYFLIVWDFIHFAKSRGIAVGPGRGSAAGSIVAYCLEITEIDPIKYSLIFERFLNSERVSMPDIDVDFCIERRQEVIDYVIEKYGKDKVSQIITFGTLKAKAAVRDVARALNASYQEGDEIAKAIPNDLGITISQALTMNPSLKERYEREPLVKNVIDMAMALEGLPRHASTHAAGVVISKLPLDEYVPLYSSDKGVATQFNMTTIEELGLLKMDFLGLRNLTIIRDAMRMIEENHGIEVDFRTMSYDDPAVFKMISEGNTRGIFQLESGGMTDFMKNLKPSCFEDIIAGIALYRPGPMDSIPKYIANKKNPDGIKYIDPHLKPILDVTYGCLIYQEQVMQIVRDLGGYSFGRSDIVRRAMSKKKMEVMLKEKEYFIHGKRDGDGYVEIAGCVANGVPEKAAEIIFDDMISFASYAFNKSHAAAYAVVAYETAWLKCHYPVEFMAALMTSVAGNSVHTADYVRNCREMGIEILPPSVLRSGRSYSVEIGADGKERIRFGLLSVKNVGTGIIDAIVSAARELGHGLKASDTGEVSVPGIYEFIGTIDAGELNRKAVESLIQAGAFDDINPNRAVLMAVCDDAVSRAQKRAKTGGRAQISLFQIDNLMEEVDAVPDLPKLANFTPDKLLAMEKEMLGVYLSGHPLDEYRQLIEYNTTARTIELVGAGEEFGPEGAEGDSVVLHGSKFRDDDWVIMAGMLTGVKTVVTKKSQEMARFSIEDFDGVISAIAFPKVFEKARNLIANDAVVGVSGRIKFKDNGDGELLLDELVPIEQIRELGAKSRRFNAGPAAAEPSASVKPAPQAKTKLSSPVKIRLSAPIVDSHGGNNGVLQYVSDILSMYPGERDVLVYLPGGRCVHADKDHRVDGCEELVSRLRLLFGEENIKV